MRDHAPNAVGGRSNQAYVLATTSIYDEWIRNNYDLQVWQIYFKIGKENKHWAKEVVKCTKKRDDVINTRYVQKKINQLSTKIAQASASIADFQIQLGTYWTQSIAGATTLATSSSTTNRTRDGIDRLEKYILQYIQQFTQHVKKLAEDKIKLVKIQIEEFKALKDFENNSTPSQWNIHLVLKSKTKMCATKNKNYQTATKRVEYDLPPKFISNNDFTFKIDESILPKDECQTMYDQMRQVVKDFRLQAMKLYVQSTKREHEILSNEIERILQGFPEENFDDSATELGVLAFKNYNEIRDKRYALEIEQSLYFLEEQRLEAKPPFDEQQQQEEIHAPTITRSLGEDFSLQL
jgi:hypothetical protein